MRRLLRSATLVDFASPLHLKSGDILVEDGIIKAVEKSIEPATDTEVLSLKGMHVSTGFCDLFADFADPGFEYKEDLRSGALAAMAGGYTAVAVSPGTFPIRDNKAQVEYVSNTSPGLVPHILPLGAITVNTAGKEPAEMIDMHRAGAVAFSDGYHGVANAGVMLRALQYAKITGCMVYSFPLDAALAQSGLAAESPVSAMLGLKGIPALAEELVVQRDIELAAYTGGHVHFTCISTAGSVDLIRRAKAKGVRVSCAVSPFHLLFDDTVLEGFDSRYKIQPVLRPRNHVDALIAGLADGTIDAICSMHTPQNDELTDVEYAYATWGAISLQTAFSAAYTAVQKIIPIDTLLKAFSHNPRQLLGQQASIKPGQAANLVWIDTNDVFTLTSTNNFSKSHNTPLMNVPLQGCVKGVILNNNLFINE